ncbi:hypothetical protein NMY22_g10793 [Coprinellus aureogranulatus]|nr:hypothetical protein NMY22_g10793 [Coprinellus aureogranulatus]
MEFGGQLSDSHGGYLGPGNDGTGNQHDSIAPPAGGRPATPVAPFSGLPGDPSQFSPIDNIHLYMTPAFPMDLSGDTGGGAAVDDDEEIDLGEYMLDSPMEEDPPRPPQPPQQPASPAPDVSQSTPAVHVPNQATPDQGPPTPHPPRVEQVQTQAFFESSDVPPPEGPVNFKYNPLPSSVNWDGVMQHQGDYRRSNQESITRTRRMSDISSAHRPRSTSLTQDQTFASLHYGKPRFDMVTSLTDWLVMVTGLQPGDPYNISIVKNPFGLFTKQPSVEASTESHPPRAEEDAQTNTTTPVNSMAQPSPDSASTLPRDSASTASDPPNATSAQSGPLPVPVQESDKPSGDRPSQSALPAQTEGRDHISGNDNPQSPSRSPPDNAESAGDPPRENALNTNPPPGDKPNTPSPNSPVSASTSEDELDLFAFFLDPAVQLTVSTLLLFPSYTPAQILGILYIQNAIIQFRSFVIVILMIKNSQMSPRQKARLIDEAILKMLSDWCIGTLAARILAGEALKIGDIDTHVKAFENTTEVGVVLSIASQVDLGYVPKKTREKGWKRYFDDGRRMYYLRKVLRPLRDTVRHWYQDFLRSCLRFALAAFQNRRWFPELAAYWTTDGPLLKLLVKHQAVTSAYLHFATDDTSKHDFHTSPFIHEVSSPHLSAAAVDVLIKRLRAALANGDDNELGGLFVLRSGPLQAMTSHILSNLAQASPIAVINFVNMANPYIAPQASSTTWHAPLTAFSAAILTLALGAVGMYGSSVTVDMILEDPNLMELLNRKGFVTLEFIKYAHGKESTAYDIKWLAWYNNRRALQLISPAPQGLDSVSSARALSTTWDPLEGDLSFINVPQAPILTDAMPAFESEFAARYNEIAEQAAQTQGAQVELRYPEDLTKLYTAAFQMADAYLAQALNDPVYESLTSLSHVNPANFGEEAYAALAAAMEQAAAQAAKDKASHLIQDPPVASADLPEDLQPLQALAT